MNSDLASVVMTASDLFIDTPGRSVGQLVSGSLLSCPPDTTVSAAACLTRALHCSSIVIVEDGLPVGIWTEHDALAIDLAPQVFDQPISAVMTQPVRAIDGNASVSTAGVRFKREKICHLPVFNGDGTPIGMLSQTDVVLMVTLPTRTRPQTTTKRVRLPEFDRPRPLPEGCGWLSGLLQDPAIDFPHRISCERYHGGAS